MANNKTIDNGVLADFTIATDEIAGVDWQYIKMAFGAEDVATIVSTVNPLPVTAITSPAAARTSDSVSAAFAVDRLMQNLTPLTPVEAVIDHAVLGDNTLVAAQGIGNIIRVHQCFMVAASAVTVRFESGAGGTAKSGQMQLAANSGFVLPFSPIGWFDTAANALLNLELSGAVSVDGNLKYTVVT